MNNKIKISFPYFGGKSSIASLIWSRLGEVSNYLEPFAGSLAVLLANPSIPKIETVNDINCFLTNWWRAVSQDPQQVIKYADYPVNEIDLHARQRWLLSMATPQFKDKMENDPAYFDAKMAGYWVWGQGASIGNNWLATKGLKSLPLLSSAGGGIHGLTYNIQEEFNKLQKRLRRVRVACGDWQRILTPSITFNSKGLGKKDITGIFLDSPYPHDLRDKVFQEDNDVFNKVFDWAMKNGNNPKLRIALCGYDNNYVVPSDWEIVHWKANGGMGNLGNSRGKDNAAKEVIYFSPHCLK